MIPWTKLIPAAVALVEMTGGLLSSNKKEKAKLANTAYLDSASLLKRIETLESNELKQAEVIQQMARQNLTLIKRAEKNYKLAITSISLSLIILILVLLLFFLQYS